MPDNFFVSKSEAKARGLSTFFAGTKCKRGHTSERYVKNGACIDCVKKKPAVAPEPKEKLRTAATGFVWTDEIRQILINAYVDTADLHGAREAIQLAPSEYYREIKRNQAFADAIKEATAHAEETMEAKAIHSAAKGNDKLILAVLKAKYPQQYSDRLKVEQTTTMSKLSAADLDRNILRFAKQLGWTKMGHPETEADEDDETEGRPPRLQ